MSGLGKPAKPLGLDDAELFLGDRQLRCSMCEGTVFDFRQQLMVTGGLALLDLEWANKTAAGAVCQQCGHVHTFLGQRIEWRPASR